MRAYLTKFAIGAAGVLAFFWLAGAIGDDAVGFLIMALALIDMSMYMVRAAR